MEEAKVIEEVEADCGDDAEERMMMPSISEKTQFQHAKVTWPNIAAFNTLHKQSTHFLTAIHSPILSYILPHLTDH